MKKELKNERAARKEQVAALQESLCKVMAAAVDTGAPPPPPGAKTTLEEIQTDLMARGMLKESCIRQISIGGSPPDPDPHLSRNPGWTPISV